ncbi:MAG: hypothetical protein WC028_16770 [Candidatus Obscuribacterales bacterium]
MPSQVGLFAKFALSFALICCLGAPGAKAQSTTVDYEKLGRKQYSQAKYKEAAASFRTAIFKGANSAAIWLSLAESYERTNEKSAATLTYQAILKNFPGTPESAKATERIAKPKPSAPAKVALSPKLEATPKLATAPKVAASPAAPPRKSLMERIYIIPPRFGHEPVSPATIRLVRSLLAGLPKTMYKILDRGKVNIYLTPNLIDKFPETVGVKNDHLGIYFIQEHGRTYDYDMYLCERTGYGKGTDLGPISSDETIKEFFYTLLSHLLNGCLEMPSKDPQFLALYKLDYANLNPLDFMSIHAYVAPVEGVNDTFAALGANIMGSNGEPSELCSRCFPRCRAWIVNRIKVLSERK